MWHPFSTIFSELGDTGDRVCRFQALAMLCEAQDQAAWDPLVLQTIMATVQKGRQAPLTTPELVELEALMLRVSPDVFMPEWQQYFENEFRVLYGAAPKQQTINNPAMLRAHVITLAAQVERLRSARRSLGLMRSIVCLGALLTAAVFFGVGSAFLGLFDGQDKWKPLTLIIILAGALGGFISGVSRLYSLSWEGDLLWSTQSVPQLGLGVALNVTLAVLEGGIFALILYVLFAAKILEGSVFPEFRFDESSGATWTTFVDAGPATCVDIAKAIVWAFAAGFSERLVPDLIGQLAGSARLKADASNQ
jgi:hypothetical protein